MGFDFNPSLWFLCRSCKQPFPNIDKLKEHKLQHHLGDCLVIKCIIFEENCLEAEWDPTSNCFPHQDLSKKDTLPKQTYQDQDQDQKPFHRSEKFQNPYVSLAKLTPQEISSVLKTNSRINESVSSSTAILHSSRKRKGPVTRSSRKKILHDESPINQTSGSEVYANEKTKENETLLSSVVPKAETDEELNSILIENENSKDEAFVLDDGGFIVASIETCPDGTGVVQFEAAEFFEVDNVNTNAEINGLVEIHYEIQSQNQSNYSPKNDEENINDDIWLEDLVSFQANDVDEDHLHTTEFIEEPETLAQTKNISSDNQLDPVPDAENEFQLDLPLIQWLLFQKEKDPSNIILVEPKPELDPTSQDNFLFVSDVNPVKCQLCQESFRSEMSLRSHVTNCWNSKKKHRYCHICSQLFSTCNIFRAHTRQIHSSSKPKFKCSSCSEDFANKKLLNFHRKHHHSHPHSESSTEHFIADANASANSNVFPCKTCNLVFKNPADVEKHEQSHTSEFRVRRRKIYPEEKSERVPKRSFQNIALQLTGERTEEQAETLETSENESNNQSKDSDFEPALVNDDGKITSSEESDQEQSEQSRLTESINSSDIQSTSKSKAQEDTHPERPMSEIPTIVKPQKSPPIQVEFGTPEQKPDKATDDFEKTLTCTICETVFDSISDLQQHLLTVHNKEFKDIIPRGKIYKCGVANCGEVFISKHRIFKHKRIKHQEELNLPQYPCPIPNCNQIFNLRYYLKQHITRHHKGKTAQESAEHILNDKAQKNIVKSDSKSKSNTKEKEQAEGETELPLLKCTVGTCNRSFTNRSALSKHELSRHWKELGKPSHVCPEPNCGLVFGIRSMFAKHMRTHSKRRAVVQAKKLLQPLWQDLVPAPAPDQKAGIDVQLHLPLSQWLLFQKEINPSNVILLDPEPGPEPVTDPTLQENVPFVTDANPVKCVLCQEFFLSEESLRKHVITCWSWNKTKHRYCYTCKKLYSGSKVLRDHNRNSHFSFVESQSQSQSQSIFRCNVCSKYFVQKRSLELHQNSRHPNLQSHIFTTISNICVICDSVFDTTSELEEHLAIAHDNSSGTIGAKSDQVFKCSVENCDETFTARALLWKHKQARHWKEKGIQLQFACSVPDCGSMFRSTTERKHHMRQLHEKMEEDLDLGLELVEIDLDLPLSQWLLVQREKNPSNIIALDPDPTLAGNLDVDVEQGVKCLLCKEVFTSQGYLREHVLNCWNFNKKLHLYCVICDRSFDFYFQLRSHNKTFHPAEPRPKFMCSKCPKEFLSLAAKNLHEANHNPRPISNVKNFLCPICGKRFRTKGLVDGHMKYLHTTEKPWKCSRDECSASFKTYTLLKKHTVRFHEPPTFTCSFCGKQLFRESDLTIHERTHTGECPFSCDKCDKVFISKFMLSRHERANHRQELGLEEFVCPVKDCDQKFKYFHSIQRHLRRKHQEKSCDD